MTPAIHHQLLTCINAPFEKNDPRLTNICVGRLDKIREDLKKETTLDRVFKVLVGSCQENELQAMASSVSSEEVSKLFSVAAQWLNVHVDQTQQNTKLCDLSLQLAARGLTENAFEALGKISECALIKQYLPAILREMHFEKTSTLWESHKTITNDYLRRLVFAEVFLLLFEQERDLEAFHLLNELYPNAADLASMYARIIERLGEDKKIQRALYVLVRMPDGEAKHQVTSNFILFLAKNPAYREIAKMLLSILPLNIKKYVLLNIRRQEAVANKFYVPTYEDQNLLFLWGLSTYESVIPY